MFRRLLLDCTFKIIRRCYDSSKKSVIQHDTWFPLNIKALASRFFILSSVKHSECRAMSRDILSCACRINCASKTSLRFSTLLAQKIFQILFRTKHYIIKHCFYWQFQHFRLVMQVVGKISASWMCPHGLVGVWSGVTFMNLRNNWS